MKYQILDLDNCISDDSRRVPLLTRSDGSGPDYHRYHEWMIHDPIANVHLLRPDVKNIILTGRPNQYFNSTTAWLKANEVEYDMLFMRPHGCQFSSPDLKEAFGAAIVHMIQKKGGWLLAAYDDHPGVIEVYRAMGLTAHRVTIHDIPYPTFKEGTSHDKSR